MYEEILLDIHNCTVEDFKDIKNADILIENYLNFKCFDYNNYTVNGNYYTPVTSSLYMGLKK